MTQTNTPPANSGFITIVRVAVFILGAYMQFYITHDLLADGSISYSVGEISSEERVTSSLFDAILLYMAFSPIFIGLILAGVRPKLYVARPWILKCLIAITVVCYVMEAILY
ncbi:MAG: hypothetical protein HZB85_10080 [Deltaproteobacteria bacterium]|nr:hypothetical protein [Deltaproteobacteria bacterium]